MNRFAVALIAVSAASAQFTDLATTYDGSVLYFASSLVQKGTAQPAHGKIFRFDSNGLALFASRERVVISSGTSGPQTNYFNLSMPQVSDDGSRVLYTGNSTCTGKGCSPARYFLTEPFGLPARVRMSRSGRYALCIDQGIDCRLWNLATGESFLASPAGGPTTQTRAVADNGAYPFASGRLGVQQGGVRTYLTDRENAAEPAINPAATKIVFTSRWSTPGYETFSRIRDADIATGSVRTLAEGYGDLTLPSISDDATRLLFLSTARFDGSLAAGVPQPHVLELNEARRAAPRMISGIAEGATSAILSGNGKVVYVTTPLGRLLKVDAESGGITELIGRTQSMQDIFPCARGSLCTLVGTGFLPGSTVAIGGVAAPVVSVAPDAIQFQAPWELPFSFNSTYQLTLAAPGPDSSPFEPVSSVRLSVVDFAPYVLPTSAPEKATYGYPPYFALAASQDFRQLITPSNPARPGDVVHVYATGLGAVAGTQQTGIPAPAEPLPATLTPISCENAEVLYSGLAPGFLGVYQVSLRLSPAVPVDSQVAGFSLKCTAFWFNLAGTTAPR